MPDSNLDRAVERLEVKLDTQTEKLEKKLEINADKMEAKIELVQAELRVTEARRIELYPTTMQVDAKIKVVNDRIDKEVNPRIDVNREDLNSINARLNNLMVAVIVTLVTTVVALLQTIFRFIPQVNNTP